MKNKIHFIITLCLVMAVLFLVYKEVKPSEKLAYLDSTKVFIEYNGTKKYKEAYDNEYKNWEAKYDTLLFEYENMVTIFKKDSSKMNDGEIKTEMQNISKKIDQIERYKKSISDMSDKKDKELSEKINAEINSYVEKYGEENGYKIIFGATSMGNVVYGDTILDITDEILLEINK